MSDENVEIILRKLNIYDTIINGEAKCYICQDRIKLDNLGGILEIDGELALICDKPSCIAKAALISTEINRE